MGTSRYRGRQLILKIKSMEKTPQENKQPENQKEKLKYTLEDLEREKQWDSGMGPNNPGAEKRKYAAHLRRLRTIENYLKARGILELSEEEKNNAELDKLYPNAKSKTIVEYKGKKYQIKYFPLEKSSSGKTVYEWGHEWQLVE